MTLTIEITPDTDRRLKDLAARAGVDETEYARRLIERSLPQTESSIDRATLDLLAQWDKEDQTSDPAEIARRNREYQDLADALNWNRQDPHTHF